MAFHITTTKDPLSSRIILRRSAAPIMKPLEPVIQPDDVLDRLSTRREADLTPA